MNQDFKNGMITGVNLFEKTITTSSKTIYTKAEISNLIKFTYNGVKSIEISSKEKCKCKEHKLVT